MIKQTDPSLIPVVSKPTLPNLIQKRPNMESVFGLTKLDTPFLRFQLLGDLDGFIEVVTKEYAIELDIKAMSQLIECIGENIFEIIFINIGLIKLK